MENYNNSNPTAQATNVTVEGQITVVSEEARALAENRQKAISFGQQFGQRLYYVELYNPDLAYNDMITKDQNTLRKPIHILRIGYVDITESKLIPNAGGGIAAIRFNANPELQFSLHEEKDPFSVVNANVVQEALDQYKLHKRRRYFTVSQREALQKEVDAHNTLVLSSMDNIVKHLSSMQRSATRIIEINRNELTDYLRQCGRVTDHMTISGQVEVHQNS